MTSTSRLLLIAAALSVSTRVLFLILPSTPLHTKTVESISDAAEYEQLAANLVQYRVFSQDAAPPFRAELFRTPGYPIFLTPFHAAFRDPTLAIVIAQFLLSLLLLWAVYQLASEIGLDRKTAVIAAFLVAVSPNLAFLSTKIVTETIFTLLLAVCLLLFNRYRRAARITDLVGAGLCSGLLVLIRPIAMFFPLVLVGYAVFRMARTRKFTWYQPLVPLVCALVVVLPWITRNGRLTGRYIISTAGEHNLFLYNAATVVAAERNMTLAQARDAMRHEALETFGTLDTTNEAEFWQRLGTIARHHVLRYPLAAAKVQALGFTANFASPISIQPLMIHSGAGLFGQAHLFQRAVGLLSRGQVKAAVRLAWNERLGRLGVFAAVVLIGSSLFLLILIVFGLIGLFHKSGRGLLWLLLPVCYFTMLTGPVGEARFRAPVEPILAVFAAIGIAAVFRFRSEKQTPA